MKKKTRDLKKHYRWVKSTIDEFEIDLSDDSWYSLYHEHLDWHGITTFSEKHRVKHLEYYNLLFDKIDNQTKGCEKKFQTWILIDGCDGAMDAIYVHTENPYSEFPFKIDDIDWNVKIPSFVGKALDLDKFNIGRFKSNNSYSYLIERKEIGISLVNL